MLWSNMAIDAMQRGLVLRLCYPGYDRLVEVHAVGFTFKGQSLIRCWQVAGRGPKGPDSGAKLLVLDEILSAAITLIPSEAPRPGYRRGDKSMAIIAQL
jgi:hypothetical protein